MPMGGTGKRCAASTPPLKESMIGYTLHIVKKNKAADGRKLGVQIGRTCINKNISARELAEFAGVSTVTVYSWFTGEYSPRKDLAEKLLNFISLK